MLNPRLLIADSHPLVQDALRTLLQGQFSVVATVGDGRSLLDLAKTNSHELVIVEICLPTVNGFEVAKHLGRLSPKPKIIFFTMYTNPDYVLNAFEAGASAYVCKTATSGELCRAIAEVLLGHQYISIPGRVAQVMVPRKSPSIFRTLTTRQREVLQLIAEGQSSRLIAIDLKISAKTVEFHKARMMAALRVRSTAELIRYAIESGIAYPSSEPPRLIDSYNEDCKPEHQYS